MKRILLVFSLILIMVATACGGSATGQQTKEEKVTVAFTTITLADRFFVRLNNGMEARAKELGIELVLQNPDGDPTSQFSAVENFIAQGTDVIIVDPLDPNGIMPAIEKAKAANIPIMAVDEVLAGVKSIDAAVGDDNFGVGKELGQKLLAYMDANGVDKASIGVIQTIDAPIENTRLAGFQEVVEANSERMAIVGRYDAKFSVDEAAKGGEDLITANPDLNFFYGTGGNYLIGALAAIKSQGAEDRIKLIGWDLSAQLIEAMEQGIYIEAAEQNAAGIGAKSMDIALKLAKGEPVERDNFVPVTYVTKENVNDFRAEYQE